MDDDRSTPHAGHGAQGLGQAPEEETATPHDQTEEDLRDENLQGSIDIIIEEWRSPEFAWFSGTEEGAAAMQHLLEAGRYIGEFRARKGRLHPAHQPGAVTAGDEHIASGAIQPTEAQLETAREEAREEAEAEAERERKRADALEAELDELREGRKDERDEALRDERPGEDPANPVADQVEENDGPEDPLSKPGDVGTTGKGVGSDQEGGDTR